MSLMLPGEAELTESSWTDSTAHFRDRQGEPWIHAHRIGGTVQIAGQRTACLRFDEYRNSCGATNSSLEAGWTVDGDAVLVRGDWLGMVPLYYHLSDQRLIVSTSLQRIVEQMPQPRFDFEALSVFLRIGYFVGDDTAIDGVRSISPGLRLRWPAETTFVAPPIAHPQPLDAHRREIAHRYLELFRDSVVGRVQAAARVGLPLSGGRDSRHVLLTLVEAGLPPAAAWTVRTHSVAGDEDVRVASELAQRFGLQHEVIELQPREAARRELAKNRLTNWCSDEHGWMLPLLEAIPANCTILDGIGGGVWSNGSMHEPSRFEALAEGRCRKVAQQLVDARDDLPYLPRRVAARMTIDRAVQRIERELRRHVAAPNPWASYLFWNRTRREIGLAPLAMLGRRAKVALPFLDPPLLQLLMALPGARFADPGFHDEVLDIGYDWPDLPSYERARPRSNGTTAIARQCGRAYFRELLRQLGGDMRSLRYLVPRLTALAAGRAPQRQLWWAKRLLYWRQLERLITSSENASHARMPIPAGRAH